MVNGINSTMGASQMAAMQSQRGNPFDKIDVNGDGSLDTDEIGAMSEMFSQQLDQSVDATEIVTELDTDGDSLISQDEFKAGKPQGPPPEMMAMGGGMQQSDYQSLLDSLEESEADSGITDYLDTNGDGIVDAEEARAGMNNLIRQYGNQLSETTGQTSVTESLLDLLA